MRASSFRLFLPSLLLTLAVAGCGDKDAKVPASTVTQPSAQAAAAADPAAAPLIDPNYWSDPHDRKMSLEGLKIAREIFQQAALKPYIMAERLPGPKVMTDDELFDYGCANAKTDHHPVGTCKMGNGPESVVGLDLKVHGLEGLRVCDSSVMPRAPSCNTNAPTIMIAEKIADLILGRAA